MPRKPSPHRQLHLLESPPRMIFDVETEEGLQEILGIFASFFVVGWLGKIPALEDIDMLVPRRIGPNAAVELIYVTRYTGKIPIDTWIQRVSWENMANGKSYDF